MKKFKKGPLITIFLLMLFVLAVVVWYSPIIFKGYSSQAISNEIVLAKNYHRAGALATYNDQTVRISSSLVKEEGRALPMSEYLGSFFYAKIFDIIGIPDYNKLILLSIILYALVLVLFTILVLYLFNFKMAVVFGLIYTFSPLGWNLSRFLGVYEFCLFFWALFFIFYFLGVRKLEQSQNKIYIPLFIFSGVFLALSAFSREVTLVFALALFIFFVLKKLKKQLIYIFVPFIIILIIFWLPSVLSGKNIYIASPVNRTITEESISIANLEVFPDPYTYYFEEEEFLKELKNQNLGLFENLETRKILTNRGLIKTGIIDRFKLSAYVLLKHISRFFSLEDFGGPLITLLLILGLIYLKSKYKFLYNLSLYWLIISFSVFAFIRASRNHLMDFIWLFILLIVFGLFYLFQIIKDHFGLKEKKSLLLNIVIIILLLYHLVLVNHVVLGRHYDRDHIPRSLTYAREIEKIEISDADVIAIPGDFSSQTATLNYLTDKSFVLFQASTLEKLLEEKKAKQALEVFGVKYILGYSDQLSDKITERTGVTNITSNSLEIDMGEISADKSFLMNLIR